MFVIVMVIAVLVVVVVSVVVVVAVWSSWRSKLHLSRTHDLASLVTMVMCVHWPQGHHRLCD